MLYRTENIEHNRRNHILKVENGKQIELSSILTTTMNNCDCYFDMIFIYKVALLFVKLKYIVGRQSN